MENTDTLLTTAVDDVHAPEHLLDAEDPSNDRYFHALRSLQARIDIAARACPPRHLELARGIARGLTRKELATKLNYAYNTVCLLAKKAHVNELVELHRRMQGLHDGPNLALRKNVLWRIAARNEADEPTVTIAAIKELNKLDGAYPQQAVQTPSKVTIVINQDQLPRTSLDAIEGEVVE